MVRYSIRGMRRKFNAQLFFLTLMANLVLLRLPSMVVLYLAMFCMGHLSMIYKKAIREPINIQDQCVSMAVRMLQLSSLYNEFSGDKGGVFVHGVRQHLYAILRHRGDLLDESEIENFVSFAFQCLKRDSAWCRPAINPNASFHDAGEHVDEYGLASASLRCEKLDLEQLVGLFNKDRYVYNSF